MSFELTVRLDLAKHSDEELQALQDAVNREFAKREEARQAQQPKPLALQDLKKGWPVAGGEVFSPEETIYVPCPCAYRIAITVAQQWELYEHKRELPNMCSECTTRFVSFRACQQWYDY